MTNSNPLVRPRPRGARRRLDIRSELAASRALYPEGKNDGSRDQEFCDHCARDSLSTVSGLADLGHDQPIDHLSIPREVWRRLTGRGGGTDVCSNF